MFAATRDDSATDPGRNQGLRCASGCIGLDECHLCTPVHLSCRPTGEVDGHGRSSIVTSVGGKRKSCAESAPLAPRHQRRSPRPASTYRTLLSTYGSAQPSSLFLRVEHMPLMTRRQLLGNLSRPSDRPGPKDKERVLTHAPSPEANQPPILCITLNRGWPSRSWGEAAIAPLRVRVWLRRVSTSCWMRNIWPLISGTRTMLLHLLCQRRDSARRKVRLRQPQCVSSYFDIMRGVSAHRWRARTGWYKATKSSPRNWIQINRSTFSPLSCTFDSSQKFILELLDLYQQWFILLLPLPPVSSVWPHLLPPTPVTTTRPRLPSAVPSCAMLLFKRVACPSVPPS